MDTQVENKELEQLQSATARTVTVDVMERQVAEKSDGSHEKTEVCVPRKVFVRPLSMRRWFKALNLVTTILGHIPTQGGLDTSNPLQMSLALMHVIGSVPDEIFAILELATDQDAAFYDRIDLDDGVRVVMAVIEVNKDFFIQKVLPMLSEVAPELFTKIESIFGQTQ